MICSLDYLVGTLATAYKGVITSLVVKDFCICQEDGSAILKGVILSMPPGGYQASLIREGGELARSPITENGGFEMRAGEGPVMEAKDLQIDILQNGRHIGTFLLKREKSGVFYTPAAELSQEVKDVDFKLLTLPLREKPGLQRKAEDVIYKILSAKKDWRKFSDELHGFATDLFWGEREVFYLGFGILVKFSSLALEKTGLGQTAGKPAQNFLDLVGLPLSRETSADKLRNPALQWLNALALGEARTDLSGRAGQAVKVFSMINEKVPEADIRPAFSALLSSLRRRVEDAPVFSENALEDIKGFIPPGAFGVIEKRGSRGRDGFLALMEEARSLAEKGRVEESLLKMDGAKADLELFLDGGELIRSFFDITRRHLSVESAPAFTEALFELLDFQAKAADGGKDNKDLISGAAEFMQRLIAAGRAGLCADLLIRAGKSGKERGFENEMVLNKDIAALILGSGDNGLVSLYRELLKGILVPSPGIRGYSQDTWAEIANPLHLDILSRFLDVLSVSGEGLEDVKAHLICNLHLSGVFIPDDRLFQRRVSGYLNSPAMRGGKKFLLNYMLLKKLPVYFSEIGAASRIRDYTTQVDSWGNDSVLYFLRKQVHVNASNLNIRLTEGIIKAWADNDPGLLESLVPAGVFRNFNKALLQVYHLAIRPFFEALGVLDGAREDGDKNKKILFGKLLEIHEELLKGEIEKIKAPEEIRSKVFLLCRIYQEIVKKYSLPYSGPSGGGPSVEGQGLYSAIGECLQKMRALKETVLSPAKTEATENLYFKRHIAFGIPSVLGTYHEEKFDALGDFLRIGERARVLMEAAVTEVSSGGKRQKARKGSEKREGPEEIACWTAALGQINSVLALQGIRNFQVEELSGIFRTNRLFVSQALDMLRMWQKELKWAVESFGRDFLAPLGNVIKAFPQDDLPDYLANLDPDDVNFVDKAADIIIRDMMAGLPGFTETDRLIDALAGRLSSHLESEGDSAFNLNVPEEAPDFFELDGLGDDDAMRLSPFLGGKAKNLVYLKNGGFDVPPGAVFSSRHTEDYMGYTESEAFTEALKKAVRKIEDKTGKIFGGEENPLFLSVRSGSYISMPGILTSILYCGMNPVAIKGFIRETGNPWLAWDSYRRFLEHYGRSVLGLDPKIFDDIKASFAKNSGASLPDRMGLEELGEGQVRGIAQAYLETFSRAGHSVPDDVYEQLRNSAKAVYASWHGERSAQFARFTGMSRRWGTSVTLMQMIYGNQPGAGASVFFTRDPATMERRIYGEIREIATGDDLVYGARTNRPVSKKQKELFGAEGGGENMSLEEKDPALFGMLEDLARRIEDAMGGLPQEVETTYCKTDGQRKVYVLQARRMEFFDSGFIPRFEEICMMEPRVIGKGIGVHGGALSGVASFSFSAEAIRELGRKTGLPVIILRHSASTNDVSLMADIGGIITAAGGATSHASVLAQKFGLTAIVGCKDLSFEASREGTPYARIGNSIISEGAPISIDGATGLIFSGTCLHTSNSRQR